MERPPLHKGGSGGASPFTQGGLSADIKSHSGGFKAPPGAEFYKYLFDTKHFSSSDLKKWKLGLSNLFINRSYYYSYQSEIDIKREFLSKEETIELYYWLEDYPKKGIQDGKD